MCALCDNVAKFFVGSWNRTPCMDPEQGMQVSMETVTVLDHSQDIGDKDIDTCKELM